MEFVIAVPDGIASLINKGCEIAGTGVGEESRLKQEVVRYKNSIIEAIYSSRSADARDASYPAFAYAPRPLAGIFAEGALFDTAWLFFFNILSFALAYAAFVRYDRR
jgi:hypothetical protein